MTRIPLIGGPADGASIPAAGLIRWVQLRPSYAAIGNPEGARGFAAPGRGRIPYRRTARGYEWVGFRSFVCGGCGAVVLASAGRCSLCDRPRLDDRQEDVNGSET